MTLSAHNLKPSVGARRRAKKIGRGNASGHGTYSTRGGKGQTARSGGSRGLIIKGFKFQMQSTPKLRGFHSLDKKPAEVYLTDLEKKYEVGEIVNLKSLSERNIISVNDKSAKILDKGELTKKLQITGVKTTKGALEKIQKAGGSVA